MCRTVTVTLFTKKIRKRRIIIQDQGGKEISYIKWKEGRVTGLDTSCVGTAFWNHLLKERYREG